MSENFKILDWDSKFFEFKVAQLKKNFISGDDLCMQLDKLAVQDIRLAYYVADRPLEKKKCGQYDIVLVAERVPVKKENLRDFGIHDNISFYEGRVPDTDLLELGQRAGMVSRFNIDPNIPRHKVEELYDIWIHKSVQKEMASDVLVYRIEGRIKGFITVSCVPPTGKVSLFAVSPDVEGKGVSFALLKAADSVLYQKGCSQYFSATQADNKATITVVKRHGLKIEPIEYFYHLWRK